MGTPQGITLNEALHPFTFLISDDTDGVGYLSRDMAVIGNSQTIVVGQVLKTTPTTVSHAAKTGGNTGAGLMTPASPAYLAGSQQGIYRVVCIGGALSIASAAKSGGNTGNGTVGSLTVDSDAVSGAWRVVCEVAATNAGTFVVFKPDGTVDGIATVAVAYNSAHGPNFTIADGSTDFIVGDEFDMTVTNVVPSNGGVFSVTDPKGVFVANATVGSAFSTQLGFTIADGAPDFIVGDEFDVTVVNQEYVAWTPGDTPAAIAGYGATTGASTTAEIAIINAAATVRLSDITFGGSPTAAQIAAAIATFNTSLVKFR
jgi:hypothetical protein